jgi:hypothetical protein
MRGAFDLDVAGLPRELVTTGLQCRAPEQVGLAEPRERDLPHAIDGSGGGAGRRQKNEAHSRFQHACHFPSFWIWRALPYNEIMARGWESKSVESQIESAESRKPAHRETKLSPEQIQTMRDRENLELSRTRVQCELASSTNPRYQEILRRGLADLEAKIAQLEPAKKAVAASAR